MTRMKRIAVLGSTGSIGRQCLSVVDSLPGSFEVVAIAAGSNVSLVADQIARYRPKIVSIATEEAAAQLRAALIASAGRESNRAKSVPLPEIVSGPEGIDRKSVV